MLFPYIRHIDDLLPHIQHKPEISIKKQPNGCTVVCYAISNGETFDSEWARECRGITFDRDGNILIRSMHKFFNVGERESTQVGNINWDLGVRIMDKRDGSMITPCVLDGGIEVKTKKSFDTDQANRAKAFILARQNYVDFVRRCHDLKLTATFEWTSPGDRIVVKYPHDELVLTQVRENESGEYRTDLARFASKYNIPLVEEEILPSLDIHALLTKLQDEEGKEGYIIQFGDGEMVKLKTPWYINLHHSVTFTRERDIARMVVEEQIDDFKSYLSQIGETHDTVNAIEKRVLDTILDIKKVVEALAKANWSDDKKEFVTAVNPRHEYFGLIMDYYVGKEPRYNEYFIKHHLSSYSLEVV
jgi:RNA ligase